MSESWLTPVLVGVLGVGAGILYERRRQAQGDAADAALAEAIEGGRAQGIDHLVKPLSAYSQMAGGDKRFAKWLKRVDDEILFWTVGQGVHDLAPRKWGAAYRKGMEPYDAVKKLVGDPASPDAMMVAELKLVGVIP